MHPPPTGATLFASKSARVASWMAWTSASVFTSRLDPVQTLGEIAEEIARILEPDLQSHELPAGPWPNVARHLPSVLRHDEAVVAAVAIAEREELEPVDESRELLLRALVELDA